ncbi:MAG: tRNA 4-thiouridine(8) synthase ThiI [Firmicutes bacterium]|nr:tRNA 4-thiouridine(8) synthase ThiI [Bacillota bacterium]
MEKIILIKYGELTTKKSNRNQFIKKLNNNILKQINDLNLEIKYDQSRMFIYVSEAHLDEVVERLNKVFGIHGIVICHPVDNNIESIKEKTLEILKNEKFNTFKIVTKRSDKAYPIKSNDVNNIIGGFILKNLECKVDVHNPDIYVNIEIRRDKTFIYTKEINGIGGYPVGIEGKGLLMLSGGIDSPVAGYLALKRGVDLECLYFESPPHTSLLAKEKVIKLASILNEYSKNIKIHIIPFTKLQEEIYKNIDDTYMITILRRMMYRIAFKVAKKRNCKVIINGESIGQVASQTLTSMNVINSVTNYPIIRPVACLDKLEIINIAKKIGTYETSILPYEDCCTIFVPRHPVINPDINKAVSFEQLIDYETLINECINNMETITITNKSEFEDLL